MNLRLKKKANRHFAVTESPLGSSSKHIALSLKTDSAFRETGWKRRPRWARQTWTFPVKWGASEKVEIFLPKMIAADVMVCSFPEPVASPLSVSILKHTGHPIPLLSFFPELFTLPLFWGQTPSPGEALAYHPVQTRAGWQICPLPPEVGLKSYGPSLIKDNFTVSKTMNVK